MGVLRAGPRAASLPLPAPWSAIRVRRRRRFSTPRPFRSVCTATRNSPDKSPAFLRPATPRFSSCAPEDAGSPPAASALSATRDSNRHTGNREAEKAQPSPLDPIVIAKVPGPSAISHGQGECLRRCASLSSFNWETTHGLPKERSKAGSKKWIPGRSCDSGRPMSCCDFWVNVSAWQRLPGEQASGGNQVPLETKSSRNDGESLQKAGKNLETLRNELSYRKSKQSSGGESCNFNLTSTAANASSAFSPERAMASSALRCPARKSISSSITGPAPATAGRRTLRRVNRHDTHTRGGNQRRVDGSRSHSSGPGWRRCCLRIPL